MEAAIQRAHKLPPSRLAAALLEDQHDFLRGVTRGDDLTLLILRRSG